MRVSEVSRVRLLDRLDQLPPWAFTGVLYVLRWVAVLPLALISEGFSGRQVDFDGPPLGLLLNFLIIAPVLETLIECAGPYWLMSKLRLLPPTRRPWSFVAVAAILMALLHLGAGPAALLPSLVTGAFLGYTYGHFAPKSFRKAFLHTTVFHAAINVVGWTMVVFA